MDMSQISELASAIMDSWGTASGATQGNAPDPINKFLANMIKQEGTRDCSGVIPIPSYLPNAEQVPMDDFDPLESFTFWDGENFYSQQDLEACSSMQTDTIMPTLTEYVEDEVTRDNGFAIKETELLNNPTLAELNSGHDTIFDYSVVDDPFFNEDNSLHLLSDGLSKTFPGTENHFLMSVHNQVPNSNSFAGGLNLMPSGFIDVKPNISLSSSCPPSSRFMPPQQFLGACDVQLCPQNSPASDSFFPLRVESRMDNKTISACASPIRMPHHPSSSRFQQEVLSSSAPPAMASYLTTKIKKEPLSPSPRSVTERSLSGFSNLSLSNDDNESGSFFDSDAEDDFTSDEDVYQYESDDILSTSCPTGKNDKSCHHRKHRYFWQYNLQSRGSKAQNILPRKDYSDPHVLNDAFDPVFSEECSLPVKHSGKARKGDGNDLTPNPCKLFNIGLELKKLNKMIYNVNPHESQGKPLSRKEKNKLASRVCRLKKKAQHEANKIKLYGLQQEHRKLLQILQDTKELLRYKIENMQDTKLSNCSKKLENYLATNDPYKVAGNTASFVNEVLEKISKGECDGGLGQL